MKRSPTAARAAVLLVSLLALAACSPASSPSPGPGTADGAVRLVLAQNERFAGSAEVARVTSAEDGSFAVALAPGSYRVVPQPVDGLMGTAAELEVRVEVGEPSGELAIAYDTGIR
jgi:hypothetical protein